MSDYTRKPKTPKGGWRQVAAGSYHTVALNTDGSVACWGDNFSDQCSVPSGLGKVAAVAAGYTHTVALKADGTVACWGNNGSGQCSVPAGLGQVASVAAGSSHTVALRSDGTVACWGDVWGLTGIPWNLSKEAWFDFIADYGNSVPVTKIVPDRIRRTEKYQDMMLLMKL